MNKVDIKPIIIGSFVTSIDYYKNWPIFFRQMDNAPVDYDIIIKNGLKDLYIRCNDSFSIENDCVLDGICDYIVRLKKNIPKKKNNLQIIQNLDNMIN